MSNLFLDVITSSPKPVGTLSIPMLVGSAFVSKLSETNRYQILSNGTALDAKLLDEDYLLLQGLRGVTVKPLPPKNKSAIGKAIEFEYDGDDVGFNRQQCDIYTMQSRELYEFQYWKGSNQLRYHNAEMAIQIARYQINPINQITPVLNLVSDSALYWLAVTEGKIEMPEINSDGTIVTPEIAKQYSEEWNFIQDKLAELSEFASRKNLVNPINEVEYEQKVRAARVTMISSALDLTNTRILDRMTANQIAAIWNGLIDMLNQKEESTELPMIAEESIESDKVEDPKSTNIRGTKQKKKSVESVELSNPSSEVEPTPLTNVEISV
jgi:hypothetical protein